jgi:CheY-like chemotaxis protein
MSRVLVVEDEAHLAQGLRFNLEAEGYAAEVVGDGEAATDRLLGKKENFDAVVLDIMLPGKDGFSVVSELRAARNYVPVLMLTARSRPEDVLKGFAAGADDYLAKPLIFRFCWRGCRDCCGAASGCAAGHRRARRREAAMTRLAWATSGHFHFSGKTIDFGVLELRSGEKHDSSDADGVGTAAHLVRNDGRLFRASRFWKKCGDCTKTPTRGPSIILWCACGAILRTIRRSRGTCLRCGAWGTGFWRSRKRNKNAHAHLR